MNIITKLMYSLHRILGKLLCILFLMWFLSAFVMMYHRFPRVSAKEKLQKQELLSTSGDVILGMISGYEHKWYQGNLFRLSGFQLCQHCLK